MKVYLVYLKIDKHLYEQMKNLLGFNADTFDSYGDYKIGLYAYTNKKNLLNDFMSYRTSCKNNYIIKTESMDKDEYDEFRNDVGSDGMIADYNYDYPIPSKKATEKLITTTKNEYIQSTGLNGCCAENFAELFTLRYNFLSYNIFKKEYKDALDLFQYNDFCILNDLISVSPSVKEVVEDSIYGYGVTRSGRQWQTFYDNEVMMFMTLFYPIIGGYDGYEDILFYDAWR